MGDTDRMSNHHEIQSDTRELTKPALHLNFDLFRSLPHLSACHWNDPSAESSRRRTRSGGTNKDTGPHRLAHRDFGGSRGARLRGGLGNCVK